MTVRQRIYFMWLVVKNAEAMVRRAHGHPGMGGRMIQQARARREQLGLPFQPGMTRARDMVRDAENTIRELWLDPIMDEDAMEPIQWRS